MAWGKGWRGVGRNLSRREGVLSADSWVAPPLPNLLPNPGSSGDTKYSTPLSSPLPSITSRNTISFSSSSSSCPLSSQLPHCTVPCTMSAPVNLQISGLTVREGGKLAAGYSNTTNVYNGRYTIILNKNCATNAFSKDNLSYCLMLLKQHLMPPEIMKTSAFLILESIS